MKQDAIVIIAGEGGHLAQMNRLLTYTESIALDPAVHLVGLWENGARIAELDGYSLLPIRHKHSLLRTILRIPRSIRLHLAAISRIRRQYTVRGVVSTGPGIAVVPSLYFRLTGANVVFIETWSRFHTRSWTGRFMYRIAHRFYVQNREQMRFYPKARFGGRI